MQVSGTGQRIYASGFPTRADLSVLLVLLYPSARTVTFTDTVVA